MKALLLTSNDGTQSGRSGYDVLADYIPSASILAVPRESPRTLVSRLKRKLYSLNAASSWYQLSSLELERSARKQLQTSCGDLVHMLWADRDWGCIDRICGRAGVPLVLTIHACPDELPAILNRPGRLLNPAAYILMCEKQKPFFLERNVPAERLHVVHHGIDVDHFQPGLAATDELRILTVGSYRRNFKLLEEVIKRFKSDYNLRFVVVSRESYRNRFKSHTNVEFLSGLSNRELLGQYQKASIFLMTAENATANNAMVEALACGLPVVCEEVGGLPEYATKDCAIHTPPGSVEKMVDALEMLIQDSNQRRRMSIASRSRAEFLKWENSADTIKKIYDAVSAKA